MLLLLQEMLRGCDESVIQLLMGARPQILFISQRQPCFPIDDPVLLVWRIYDTALLFCQQQWVQLLW